MIPSPFDEEERKKHFLTLASKYEEALKTCKKEEDIHSFLKTNPELAMWSLSDGARPIELVSKFPLGREYVTDFVVFGCRSFGIPLHCILIELEPPNAHQFTKQGVYSKTLNHAIKQINDWMFWLKNHYDEFCMTLPTKLTEPLPSDLSVQLRSSYLSYKIVIGRRSFMTRKDRQTIASIFDQHHGTLEIATYDRILDNIKLKAGILTKGWYEDKSGIISK